MSSMTNYTAEVSSQNASEDAGARQTTAKSSQDVCSRSQDQGLCAPHELKIGGMTVAKSVIAGLVAHEAEKVSGVARVGGNDIASNLISVLTSKKINPDSCVESAVLDGKLKLTVHLAVFFGYPFPDIASSVRRGVARTLSEQLGCEIASLDVCIDSLVFPKN